MSVCPRCASEETKQKKSDYHGRSKDGNIQRLRECLLCGLTFITEERATKVFVYDSRIMKKRAIDAKEYLKTQMSN